MPVNGIDGQSSISSVSGEKMGVGNTTSLQFMFAELQMELAKAAKESAMDKMNQIKTSQDERKKVSALLNECRQAQANAKKDEKATNMSADCKKYMDENNLAYPGKDEKKDTISLKEDEWKVAIESLTGRLDELGSDTQQIMIYVQDFMGQYNSYLQGANTQISNGNQTLLSLARGQ